MAINAPSSFKCIPGRREWKKTHKRQDLLTHLAKQREKEMEALEGTASKKPAEDQAITLKRKQRM